MADKYYIADPQTRNRSSCSLANLNRPRHGLGSEISLGQALICKDVFVHFEKQVNIKTLSNVYLKYLDPGVLTKSNTEKGGRLTDSVSSLTKSKSATEAPISVFTTSTIGCLIAPWMTAKGGQGLSWPY